ncbi:MAG: hypothetical protein HYS09_04115 [Chloroflexi bacterium]|nr:hypothetical protein [Chloroflexota bacterium]
MAQYLLHCREHTDAECEEMNKEFESYDVPEGLKGRDFYCSCPHGVHGGWMVVEASSADAALPLMPPINRSFTKAIQVDTMTL